MTKQSTHLAVLCNHPLFKGLPESALDELEQATCSRRLQAGQTLYYQGDSAQNFFILVHGQLKLHRHSSDGNEHVLGIVRPGGALGETLLYDKRPTHLLTATALRDSLVIQIHNTSYRNLLERYPQLAPALLTRLSERLNQRLEDIDNLATSSANHRVARFLMLRQKGTSGVVELDIPKRLIASKLGIQPETLSRILHRLSDAGLISMHSRRIDILDQRKLAAFLHDSADQSCRSMRSDSRAELRKAG